MANDRPNPDALLAEVQHAEARQQRGRLKIFFGMSAGVGKTFAMLEEARKRAAEGADVLIGYAEPHIRSETEALLLGMELLPYKVIEYRNARLNELDLDAAIARKPAILCVDEMAHTNAPGMRHPKRWQDVAEILDAGISVYTTLNVQHLESVNDLVERITGVRVGETLPDLVFEQADEVELVDIAPEELLERFREGKVYRADQAERAAMHFFTKGNLIALRELSLRKTAERVDAQIQDYRRDQRIRHVIPASDSVLVCVGPSPLSAKLVRSARRLAASLRAKLIAIYVESPSAVSLPVEDRRRVERNLRLAEELGAQTITLSGRNVADEVLTYAFAHNVTKIVVGKPVQPRWRELLFGSVVDDLIRRSGEIDLYVIRAESLPGDAVTQPPSRQPTPVDWRGYIAAAMMVVLATAVGWPLYHRLGIENENVLMLYLVGVLWVATHYSRAAAIAASVLSVATFDLFFVPPHYTFAVSDRQYVVTFVVMLMTALVISALTHRVRAQAESARQRERRTAAMLELSRELSVARTAESIAKATTHHITDSLGERAVLLLCDANKTLVARADSGNSPGLSEKEMSVAHWAYEHDQPAGRGTPTLPAAEGTYAPLRTPRGVLGVIGVLGLAGDSHWSGERRQLIESFASQAALAIERANLAEEARIAWERVEAEFLRNTLLSGVSHDLRTPLAGITGAASALAQTGATLTDADRAAMLDTIQSESERMDRLINNLLDMTRLEAGRLQLQQEWLPLQEVIGSALHHLERNLKGKPVRIDIPADLPMMRIDGSSIEQVLTNLIDNAIQYTPTESPIEITARRSGDDVIIEIADRGPGLPVGTEKRVFEKFFRAAHAQSTRRRGIGLGLPIARGIIEAHGGSISAANRPDGGAIFRCIVPIGGIPPVVEREQGS